MKPADTCSRSGRLRGRRGGGGGGGGSTADEERSAGAGWSSDVVATQSGGDRLDAVVVIQKGSNAADHGMGAAREAQSRSGQLIGALCHCCWQYSWLENSQFTVHLRRKPNRREISRLKTIRYGGASAHECC